MKIVIETWGCVVIFRKIMVLYFTICPWAVIFNIKPWSIQCPTQSNARRSIVQPSSRMTIKLHTGGIVRWLKKSSKETMTRVSICIWFWNWSPSQNSRIRIFVPRPKNFWRSGKGFIDFHENFSSVISEWNSLYIFLKPLRELEFVIPSQFL